MDAELIGRALGDFQIESFLGRGSMARVYQARQISLRRNVALKVLEEGLFTPGENVKRFLREAEAMARLEHPNIVPVYAAGEETPYYYFAMRLVRGGTLEDRLRDGITRATALGWANDVCRALAFAHEAGVVHRDLKPTNVMIHDDVALLSDFGLARLRDMSTITQMGFVLGTPLYMAPEQTLGESAGPPADCFALGVILYQMFTGHHPFVRPERRGLSRAEVRTRLFKRIQEATCPPPSTYERNMPPLLEKVIMRALARRPEDRFPDGHAMLHALEEASLQGPGAEPERIIRWQGPAGAEAPGGQVADAVAADAVASTTPLPAESSPARGEARREGGGANAVPAGFPGTGRAAGHTKTGKGARQTLGRYRIVKEIGHGGQGVVYQAHDPVLDRTVALKVLRADAVADTELVEAFRREARVAARLAHPHIITIYDFGVEQHSPYITMQLVEGPSLDRVLEPQQPLPVGFVLQVLAQVAEALGFAHKANVVHLDVKPGNVLLHASLPGEGKRDVLSGKPHALLTDFTMAKWGKAKAHQVRASASGPKLAGTFCYASPEQLSDNWDALQPGSDVFSLGVVLHEMLTGRRLFTGDDPAIVRELVLTSDIIPPSVLTPGLPQAVDELCMRMLVRPVAQRLGSATEVAAQAQAILRTLEG
ncbi:MAG: serine/threonine-protein kinase [Planctomycetota bacterium]|nr:serine/threonine-protein kinase [Planctomycetota bacterium]